MSTGAITDALTSDNKSTDALKELCPSNESSTEAAVLASMTNNALGKQELNDLIARDSVHSAECRVPVDKPTHGNEEPKGLAANESNLVTGNTNPLSMEMETLTQPFEPPRALPPVMKYSNDPLLFNIHDWVETSTAADPSSPAFVSDGMTLTGRFPPGLETPNHQRVTAYSNSTPEPALRLQHIAPLVTNPNLVDIRTGRRRSQSVPPTAIGMPIFTRRLDNGKMLEIGTPQPQGSIVMDRRAAIAYTTSPSPFSEHAFTNAPRAPLRFAATSAYCHPSGMATQPVSPALAGAKRAFGVGEGALERSGAAAPSEAKRRVRRKVENPPGAAPAAADVWDLEPILENMRGMIERRMAEVRSQNGTELEM